MVARKAAASQMIPIVPEKLAFGNFSLLTALFIESVAFRADADPSMVQVGSGSGSGKRKTALATGRPVPV
jgi:hypothetical protein